MRRRVLMVRATHRKNTRITSRQVQTHFTQSNKRDDLYTEKEYIHADIRYEQASILNNIGAMHSYLGCLDKRSSDEVTSDQQNNPSFFSLPTKVRTNSNFKHNKGHQNILHALSVRRMGVSVCARHLFAAPVHARHQRGHHVFQNEPDAR